MSRRRSQNRMFVVGGGFVPPVGVSIAEKDEAEVMVEAAGGLKGILKKRKESGSVKAAVVVEPVKKKVKTEKVKEGPKERETLRIVLGTYDSCVAGYDYSPVTNKLAPLFAVKPHTGYISGIALSDKWILSGASDETISIFASKKLKEVGSCGSEGTPTTLSLIKSNLLVSSSTGVLQILRTSDWMTIWKEQAHKKRINDLSLHSSGSLGITVGDDGFMKLWDFTNCKLVLQIKLKKSPNLVNFTPSGDLYVLCFDTYLEVFNLKGNKVTECKLPTEAHCATFISDTSLLLGLEDGTLQLYNVTESECKLVWKKEAHTARIRALSFATDENKKALVSVCSAGSMVIWEVDRTTVTEVKRMNQGCRFTAVSALWK
eukprot:TRINITY_DN19479_c0_g1_i1.p1 TRINITY_DN19479_c0_g1~~TRINITY_DN19479_c0_g1_i1.p1  ORF type:complete len:392 (+),score=98.90 TRINITY_DN19479_c0_g1_i1:55-1176(+)